LTLPARHPLCDQIEHHLLQNIPLLGSCLRSIGTRNHYRPKCYSALFHVPKKPMFMRLRRCLSVSLPALGIAQIDAGKNRAQFSGRLAASLYR
jgi:hypothetical protein